MQGLVSPCCCALIPALLQKFVKAFSDVLPLFELFSGAVPEERAFSFLRQTDRSVRLLTEGVGGEAEVEASTQASVYLQIRNTTGL